MTAKKLLENLNRDNYLQRQYKIIAKTQNKDAKSVYILQSDNTGEPRYILRYRLDIDFLCDVVTLVYGHLTSSELKHFERAIEGDK